jgi:hypothetical protein
MASRTQRWIRTGLLVSLVALPAIVLSADRAQRKLRKPSPASRTVEMFAAIEAQEIDVKLIPKDSTQSKVIIKNNTKKPLSVKLPDAFAGVPVLAQIGGVGGLGGGGRGGNSSANQSMGGGMMGGGMMGGGMMGGGMMGGGGGMFSVAPEQVAQFKVATVCLEHGKKEPRSGVPYKIVPIEEFTTTPGVKELLTALGNGRLNQRATQAAAWHLANNMSWQQLAAKRIVHLDGTSEQWFSWQELRAGMHLATAALIEARGHETPPASPGQSESANRAVSRVD